MADLDPAKLEEIYAPYIKAYGGPPKTTEQMIRDGRVIAGQMVEGAASMPALPTDLYQVGDMVARKVLKTDKEVLPGADASRAWSDPIHEVANNIGEAVAGEKLISGLLSNPDQANQVGNVLKLITPIPIAGPALKAMQGAKAFDTGSKAINIIKDAGLTSALIASPVMPVKNVAAAAIANVAIGGIATAAAETWLQPYLSNGSSDPAVIEQGDQVAKAAASPVNIDKFLSSTAQSQFDLDQFLQKATDTSTAGIEQAVDAGKEMEHFIKSMTGEVAEGYTASDYMKAAGALGLTIIGAGVARRIHNAKTGVVVRGFGGEDLSTRALSGKDGFTSAPDVSVLGAGDIAKAQATDASHPLVAVSKNPETMRAKFEAISADPQGGIVLAMEDGKLRVDSNVQFATPLKDTQNKITSLDPDGRELLRTGLVDASEGDNRIRMWRSTVKDVVDPSLSSDDPVVRSAYRNWLDNTKTNSPNRTPENIEKQHSFHKGDTTFGELENNIKAARQDPLISSIMDDIKDVNRKLLDYRVEQGRLTPKERDDLVRERPNFIALPIEGSHMAPLDMTRAGGLANPGDPISQIVPYIAQTLKEVAHGNMQTAFFHEQNELARAGNKVSRGLLGKIVSPDSINQYNKDKIFAYRDATGKLVAQEVLDPTIRQSLRSDAGSGALRMTDGWVRWASAPSRALEWATTGPVTAVVGSPFAMGNWVYGTGITMVNRPKGTVVGVGDRLVQNMTGGRIGLRADPTFIVQSGLQAVANVTAVLAKYGAKALENVVVNHNIHGAAVGGGTLDAVSKVLSNYYKHTIVHDLETRGIRGGATPMYQARVQSMADLEATMSPVTRYSKGWAVTRDLLHDVFGAVGNAPQGAFYKQNKGRMSEELLTTRTRNIMGDPSKSGLAKSGFGKGIVGGIVISPWGGVTIQSAARFMKAWKENPLGTATAILGTIGIPSYIISAYNMSLGPEYLEYQHMLRSSDEVAGEFYIGIPGRPREEGVRLRIDQMLRPFKVLADTLIGYNLGLFDGSIYKPENEYVKNAVDNSLSERYGMWGKAMQSAAGQILPAIPPVANAGAIAMGMGGVGRSYMEPSTKIVDNKNAGASDSTSSQIDNKLFGYNVSAEMDAMINALGGQLGRGIYETLVGIEQSKKDGLTASDATRDFVDRFGQRISVANREIAQVWGHASVMSPSQEATSQALRPKIDGLKKMEAVSEKYRQLSGSGMELTGGRKREIEAIIGTTPVNFRDQQMMALAHDAQAFMKQYDQLINGNLKSQYQQRASIQSSTTYTPDTKTKALNEITMKIVDFNRQGMNLIKQWEWRESKYYNRQIDISKIKLGEPITQFQELL